jgi:AcrR family transcriptional regulator
MMRRRDRRRQETIDDIKDTACHLLAGGGPSGISMRAIARHLAMTASAVHYYFPSRQALLDALIVDGFTSLAGPCGLPAKG